MADTEPGSRVLIAEDDRSVRESLLLALGVEGYDVEAVNDGAQALEAVALREPDVILLDIMMPVLDGLTVCRRLRAGKCRTPILMLTARHEISDRVSGLDAGADDYLAKPFSLDELLARLRALLRRTSVSGSDELLRVADLRLDPLRRSAERGGRALELTKTEFDLLELLMLNAGIVLGRDTIYDRIWGFDFETGSRSLDVYIGYLRRKTEADGGPPAAHRSGCGIRGARAMSLRWRIALGLALIAALVCALGATGAYLTTARQLQNSIDDSLLARAQGAEVRGFGPRGPSETPEQPCPPPGLVQPAAAAQAISPDGTVRACIEGGPDLPVTAADVAIARRDGTRRLHTSSVDGTRYRVLTVHRIEGGALQTARSLAETEDVLSSLRLQLLALSVVGIAAAALLGWAFARRLVRPIERLRDTAERIARTQDLEAPIPESGGGEVGSLATSFSTMVDALAVSKRQQQQLVTDASHELRTPLTSLRTNAELLDRPDALNAEQQQRAVHGIRLEVNELTDLVSELVELATDRADDEHPEPVPLRPLADDVAERARRRTGREIDVVVEGSPGTVLVGPHMAERALANLVDNAVKYSPGAITVVVSGNRVEVRDHGPGIAPSDQAQVFDRFYRSAEARTEPGSGLGLAIVRQIVERHAGTVWATNRDDGGAAVGFELPGAAPAASSTPPS